MNDDVATYIRNGVRQRDLFRTSFYAVLGISAFLYSTVSCKGTKPFFFEDFAGRMIIEELDLGNGGGSDKTGRVIELRTDLHAAGAGDAVGERVIGFLLLGEDTRTGAEVVRTVDRYPRFYAHQVFEQNGAINLKVSNKRELGERLHLDGLLKIVDQSRAGHAGFAIDAHGTGAADLLEAV